jgi:transcription-repair coupling factor (superfamily II helicase)
VQAVAYLLTSPDEELSEASRARLSTLVAFDRLGSGLAVAMRDLEIRGAGDIIGDQQAGHVTLLGAAFYQELLTRAVRQAKGEATGSEFATELNIGGAGSIPESYDPAIRINLYARLARIKEIGAVDAFAEELEDRFGPAPREAEILIEIAKIRALAQAAGVVRIDAGPKGIAFTLAPWAKLGERQGAKLSDDRMTWDRRSSEASSTFGEVQDLLNALL